MKITCETTTLLPKANTSSFHWHDFKIEPALACVLFGWYLSLIIIPNQLLRQTCLTRGFNATDCDRLVDNNGTKEIEERVQPEVSTILLVASLELPAERAKKKSCKKLGLKKKAAPAFFPKKAAKSWEKKYSKKKSCKKAANKKTSEQT